MTIREYIQGYLDDGIPLTMTQVATDTGKSRAAVHKVVKKLVKRGKVKLIPGMEPARGENGRPRSWIVSA